MTERQRNSLAHLWRTLADLGSADRQRRYKQSVPFVHVPIELAAQCDGVAELLGHDEFRGLFEPDEVRDLLSLIAMIRDYSSGEPWSDVDDGILDDPDWRAVMARAQELHDRMVASGRLVPVTSGTT